MTTDSTAAAAAATTKRYTEMMEQSQQALFAAVDSWTKTMRESMDQFARPSTAGPAPDQVIDQVFDFATQMLEVQRDFSKQLVAAASSVPGAPTDKDEAASAD